MLVVKDISLILAGIFSREREAYAGFVLSC